MSAMPEDDGVERVGIEWQKSVYQGVILVSGGGYWVKRLMNGFDLRKQKVNF